MKPIKSAEAKKMGWVFLFLIIVSILTIVTLKTNNIYIVMTMRESTLTQAGENKLPTDKPLKVRVCVSLMKCQYYQYIYIDISLI